MKPAAREAAVQLLIAVLEDGRTLDEAMAASAYYDSLAGRDRGFAAAIVRATLRHLGRIDLVLAAHLQRPLPDTAARGRAILRTGAAQLLFMGVAAHAAVGEAVTLAHASSKSGGFAKLINAVLRKVSASAPAADPALDLPDWLRARWTAAYGATAVSAIAAAQGCEPPLDISVREDAPGWAARLGGVLLPTGSVRLVAPAPVPDLAGYKEGAWWIQDAAAALPVRLFGDLAGKDALDLCAAPGGKTLQLAAAGARVVALDVSAPRLGRLSRALARTRLTADIVCADALSWAPPRQFDAVLLDAPCSATGTVRRHPEAPWLRSPAQVRGFAQAQAALLEAARRFLKPDGVLVYAVCSLEPEEGAALIEAALATGAWRRIPLTASEIAGADDLLSPAGDLRTLPSHFAEQGGLDGFYAARLTRT